MEQVVVITVFAICAAICVKILVVSYLMTVAAVDTKNALLVAESAAESYKAFSGDLEQVAEVFGGPAVVVTATGYDFESLLLFFDSSWQPVDELDASFVLRLDNNSDEPLINFADITVSRLNADELISLTVAVRGNEQ